MIDIIEGLEALDLKDWAVIKSGARELYNAGQYDKDQVKCYIASFIIWCSYNDYEIKLFHQRTDSSSLH